MANDLVQWRRPVREEEKGGEEWNEPPSAASSADKDAANARRLGDTSFAAQRESDAKEQRQKRWDWGDAPTWLWLFGMCAVFLLVCAFVYFMPYGRHNQSDLPTSVPPIRVY